MSRRPSNRSSRRNATARALTNTIEILGRTPDIPYSYYYRNNKSYIVDPSKSSSYSKYVRCKGRCVSIEVGNKCEYFASIRGYLLISGSD